MTYECGERLMMMMIATTHAFADHREKSKADATWLNILLACPSFALRSCFACALKRQMPRIWSVEHDRLWATFYDLLTTGRMKMRN
jgi:hypothetical protein